MAGILETLGSLSGFEEIFTFASLLDRLDMIGDSFFESRVTGEGKMSEVPGRLGGKRDGSHEDRPFLP